MTMISQHTNEDDLYRKLKEIGDRNTYSIGSLKIVQIPEDEFEELIIGTVRDYLTRMAGYKAVGIDPDTVDEKNKAVMEFTLKFMKDHPHAMEKLAEGPKDNSES